MPKVIVPENKKKLGLKDLLSVQEPGSNVMRDPNLIYQDDPAARLKSAVGSLTKRAPAAQRPQVEKPMVSEDTIKERAPMTMNVLDMEGIVDNPEDIAKKIEDEAKPPGSDELMSEIDQDLAQIDVERAKGQGETPKSKDQYDGLFKAAMIPALTTGIGALFGGFRGGEIGAQAGKGFLTKKEELEKAAQQKELLKQKSNMELAKVGLQKDPDTGEIVPDPASPYWTQQDLKNQVQLAQIAAIYGKEYADKFRQQLEQQKLDLAKKKLEFDMRKAQSGVGKGSKEDFNRSTALRKEFNAQQVVKDYEQVSRIYNTLQMAKQNPSGATDIQLITMYQKANDPTTGVRDQEFKNAASLGGWADKLEAAINKVNSGQMLTPAQRKEIYSAMENNLSSYKNKYDDMVNQYMDLSSQYGVNPEMVFGKAKINEIKQGPSVQTVKPANKKGPKPGDIEDGHKFIGGNPADPKNWVEVK